MLRLNVVVEQKLMRVICNKSPGLQLQHAHATLMLDDLHPNFISILP